MSKVAIHWVTVDYNISPWIIYPAVIVALGGLVWFAARNGKKGR